jgi:hypothetical protein
VTIDVPIIWTVVIVAFSIIVWRGEHPKDKDKEDKE